MRAVDEDKLWLLGWKKIKLEQLQTVRTDEVGVACQWNGDPMDAQGGKQIDVRPECRGTYTSSKLCLSTDPHLRRGADVGTLANHLPKLALKVTNVIMY